MLRLPIYPCRLVGADLCVCPGVWAHTQVRPYKYDAIDSINISAKTILTHLLVQTQNTYFATGSWFDRLTTNGSNPFALSLSKGGNRKQGLLIMR